MNVFLSAHAVDLMEMITLKLNTEKEDLAISRNVATFGKICYFLFCIGHTTLIKHVFGYDSSLCSFLPSIARL